ncbi:MAG: N-formylglutamate amidohydrolase [Acetobacteraceae bacterium]
MALLPLLGPDEPGPVSLRRPRGRSAFLFTADHAGRRIPCALGTLGLSAGERTRHIAWDIGIAGVTRRLAATLDAAAVLQRYSRLVIDCNRPRKAASAFPEISDGTDVPGNRNLSEVEKERRRLAIFTPYHAAIEAQIESRAKSGLTTLYVAMHSFTPVFGGNPRKMQCAVLYDRNPRLSLALFRLLSQEENLVVAENAPYRLSDHTDYGVPVHAEARGLDYLEIEIRQDLIADAAGETAWAERLARLLPVAANLIDERCE